MVYEPTMSPDALMLIARVALALGKSIGGSSVLAVDVAGATLIGSSSPTPINAIIISSSFTPGIARVGSMRLAKTESASANRVIVCIFDLLYMFVESSLRARIHPLDGSLAHREILLSQDRFSRTCAVYY